MPFAEIENIRIDYELTGSPGLPVLLFSNSLGANLSIWDLQVTALDSHFQILRYDTRGHSHSPGARPLSIVDLGRDVLGLLDILHIERVSFCGLSMGGSIGQWLGINAPSRLNKLILANTAAKIGNNETWNSRITTALQEGLGPIIPGTVERWFSAGFRQQRPDVIKRIRAILQKTNAKAYAACCGAIRDADFRSSISSISLPTLVIAGSLDPVTTPEDGRFLASSICGAQYIELEAAHLSNVEAAETFNAALLAFLED